MTRAEIEMKLRGDLAPTGIAFADLDEKTQTLMFLAFYSGRESLGKELTPMVENMKVTYDNISAQFLKET